jgi:hypothetical protein
VNLAKAVAIALWCVTLYNLPRITELDTRRAGIGIWRAGTCALVGWVLWHRFGAS